MVNCLYNTFYFQPYSMFSFSVRKDNFTSEIIPISVPFCYFNFHPIFISILKLIHISNLYTPISIPVLIPIHENIYELYAQAYY